MKLATALAVALAGLLASTAYAQTVRNEDRRIIIRAHNGPVEGMSQIDADRDGWVTRAEAAAEADRMFAEMDTNDDGKLDGADGGPLAGGPRPARGEGAERGPIIERNVVVVGPEGEERDVLIPAPPHPPRPPVVMMLIANSEESDANGDGALSREEFRAQQLRFFDAGDGNGDGRVRFEPPPEMPEPPPPPRP